LSPERVSRPWNEDSCEFFKNDSLLQSDRVSHSSTVKSPGIVGNACAHALLLHGLAFLLPVRRARTPVQLAPARGIRAGPLPIPEPRMRHEPLPAHRAGSLLEHRQRLLQKGCHRQVTVDYFS
jgi:hypothetical protein